MIKLMGTSQSGNPQALTGVRVLTRPLADGRVSRLRCVSFGVPIEVIADAIPPDITGIATADARHGPEYPCRCPPATSLNPPPNGAPKPATDLATKLVCGDGDRVVYGPDFFASSRPATALAMAELVPGFVMRGGTFGCGMEGSAANVPIGGQQVPCKGEGVAVALARTPAGYVVKIVRLRGAKAGFDMGGYA